ncbi:MAG: sialate O-acetylesterase [Epibacterium sp.]|nr:sialate O-acetylesterase [Epibacterium sp.]NQX73889.1 hypothetical protein [Epibacterium sp.]
MSMALSLGIGVNRGGGPVDPWAGIPTDGLVAEWRFSEGTGTAVADEVGSNDIDLTTPTTPNTTWVDGGVRTQSGLIQTPSITARTIAYCHRIDTGGGFAISGGASSGNGALDDFAQPADTWHIGQHAGVSPVRFRATGDGAEVLIAGGWRVVFRELDISRTSIYGFGGRHSTTTSRCGDATFAWVAAWDDTLTDTERLAVYNTLRGIIAARETTKRMDWRDCATKANAVFLWGQSNAEGRASISNLSAEDQAITFSQTKIATTGLGGSSVIDASFADLDLGVNQQRDDPANEFGPETFLAHSYEQGSNSRDLYISKSAKGNTWLASSADPNVSASFTWSPDELETSAGIWQSAFPAWWQQRATALDAGIGLDLRAFCWMQGENDATADTTSSAYNANLTAFKADIRTYTGVADLPFIAGRITNVSGGNATWEGRVRDAIDAVADTSIDTDAFGVITGDEVHYSAAGQKSLGQAFAAAVSWG